MADLQIPGLAPWMSEADYHADSLTPVPSLSSTLARLVLNRSPKHAWTAHPRLNPSQEPRHSEAFDIGKGCHTLLLGRGAGVHVIEAEDWRSGAARAERDDARAAGLVPMLGQQFDATMRMVKSVQDRLAQMHIAIEPGRTEIPAYAEIDGVLCRAMVDCAPTDPRLPLMDLKTCEDASPGACIRAVTGYGLDVQCRWYQEVWEAATGEKRRLRLVFVEKSPPHEVSIVELYADPGDPADWSADAAAKCAEARRIWAECMRDGEWPGYDPRIAQIGAPSWHRADWEARETGQPVTRAALERARAWQAPLEGDAV